MKRKLQMLISASAASVLTFSVMAQDTPDPGTDKPDDASAHWPPGRTLARLNDAARASDVIGTTVYHDEDAKINP